MIKHIHRGLWLTAGIFFLLLGLVGLMLPVVPQLPFFLLAVFSFMRCSARFTAWMEQRPWFMRLKHRFHRFHRPAR